MTDRAMTNYNIKRLVGSYETEKPKTTSYQMRALQPAVDCLRHPDEICSHKGDVLERLGCSTGCSKTLSNTTAALEIAKRVLNEQFDFILFERMHDEYSVQLLSRILQEPSPDVVRAALRIEKNVGPYNTTRTGKAQLLPPEFLEYIRKDNAADLELYEYAKELFAARARDEQWVYYREEQKIGDNPTYD
jgi:hypothetical protein